MLSILDYRTAFQLAWPPLVLPPLHTWSRESSLKHISENVIPLLKTFHVLLIGPKTLWWLIRLYIHRPLLTWYCVPFSVLPRPSHLVATILNFSGFHESVMLSHITSLCICYFPTKNTWLLVPAFCPHPTIISVLLESFPWSPKSKLCALPLGSYGIM